MRRALRVLSVAERGSRALVDTVILDFERRRMPSGMATGTKGTQFEFALPQPQRLKTDDVLLLDDDTLVEVVAAAEPLIEARAEDLPALARMAWHLGDRHVPVQVLANRVRLRPAPALETLLTDLGARIKAISAPFEPEGGGEATRHTHAHHDHAHDHRDAHDHGHGHGHAHHHGKD